MPTPYYIRVLKLAQKHSPEIRWSTEMRPNKEGKLIRTLTGHRIFGDKMFQCAVELPKQPMVIKGKTYWRAAVEKLTEAINKAGERYERLGKDSGVTSGEAGTRSDGTGDAGGDEERTGTHGDSRPDPASGDGEMG